MNTENTTHGRKPHTAGWLVGAIVCSILPIAPAAFVYQEWKDINEFTFMVTMIPILAVLLLGFAALVLWLVWIFQFLRSRKLEKHSNTSL